MSRQKEQLKDLAPRAYAPYANPRDYILSWTDEIWVTKALGRLGDHYSQDIKVHTAYGETYGFGDVIGNSVQKMSAFPNAGGGSGEGGCGSAITSGGCSAGVSVATTSGDELGVSAFG